MPRFEARVSFDIVGDATAGELEEISMHIAIAVDKWRYHGGSSAAWKMQNIEVRPYPPVVVEPPETEVVATVGAGVDSQATPAAVPSLRKLRVLVQKWEESEAGWGTRPDGYSIHPDEAALKRYVDVYWARQPAGPAPVEYERPCGTPYWAEVEVEGDIGDGKRIYRHDKEYNGYPGDGGPDGWKSGGLFMGKGAGRRDV